MNFWKVPGERITRIEKYLELCKNLGYTGQIVYFFFDPELEKLIVQNLGYKCGTFKDFCGRYTTGVFL